MKRIVCAFAVLPWIAACPSDPEPAAAQKKVEVAPDKVVAAKDGGDKDCIYADDKDGDRAECPGGPAEPEAPAEGGGHFGDPFALASAVPLSKAITAGGEEPVQITGEVEAVCQKKGCWMVVRDGSESARVLMKDHAFAVPMDCRGKAVTVEGTLASRTFTEGEVKHLEKDAGRDPSKVSGERTEHVLTASAVEIKS